MLLEERQESKAEHLRENSSQEESAHVRDLTVERLRGAATGDVSCQQSRIKAEENG